jgi:diguanylate cyclase (GGDEF)-like protein/PAS domain S-box-containing protein
VSQWMHMLIYGLGGLAVGMTVTWLVAGTRSDNGNDEPVLDNADDDQALRESESRYRLLAENATDVIWKIDWPTLEFSYVSPSVTRLRGLSVEEAMAERFTDSIVPGQREKIRRMLESRVRAYRAGQFEASEAQRVQVRQMCADGSEKVVEIIASLAVDDTGEVVGVQGISRDVTSRVRAERDSQARETILHALAQAARMLFSATDKDEVMESALAVLGQAVGADRVYVFENHLDPETGELLASQRYEWCGPGITPELDNPAMQGMSYDQVIPNWRVRLEAGQAVHGLVDELPRPERDLLEPQDIQSIAVVPVFLGGNFWGQIGFDDCTRRHRWSQAELDALEIAAGVIGGAISSIRTEEELRRLVSTDSLTGVSSRRSFLERAGLLFSEAAEENVPIALLLMDLDHFKSINDSHGHPVGDEALKAFARICVQTLRSDDLVGRTGGEEFAAALRGADLERAQQLAEKLRRNVASQPLQLGSTRLSLTVSIGVAVTIPGEGDLAGVLKQADDALYKAKKGGRNRVMAGGS